MAHAPDMLRVLLVEDEEAHAELLGRAFEDAERPWEIRHAARLSQARQILAGDTIDVVLTDLMLPDGRGIELVAESDGKVERPVVLMTSHGDEQSAVEAMRVGAADYVVKSPAAFAQMPLTLERIVREWRHRRELEALEHQVRQAQKLEAVGRLTSGIAHDFNNLLMGLLGCSDLALARLTPDHPAYPYLREVRRATERGAALTKQLVTFSGKRPPSDTVVDLNASVAELHPLLTPMIGEELDLEVELAVPGPWVRCDRVEMEQILVNLVVNARDAFHRDQQGGRIHVETALVDVGEQRAPRLRGLEPGPYAVLRVRDTGSGIDPAIADRLFEPFFTTKEVGKGTGLGLSTVHGIVRECGGTITVDSELGRGTTFTVLLPAVDADALAAASEGDEAGADEGEAPSGAPALPREARAPGSRDAVVLLIEDEPLIQMSVREYLEAAGFDVLTASRGDEAVELAQRYIAPIDLILSDVSLPGLGGPELARRITAGRPEARVMFMTAHEVEGLVRDGRVDASTRVLRKPFGAVELIGAVEATLGLKPPSTPAAAATPAPSATPSMPAEAPAPRTGPQLDGPTLLLVDDHGLTRRTLKLLLEESGYAVIAAGTMHSALESYREHPEIELVVSDLSLPDGDGKELIAALRHHEPELPFILVTGRSEADPAVAAALTLPRVDHMLKPIDVDQLCARIEGALEG